MKVPLAVALFLLSESAVALRMNQHEDVAELIPKKCIAEYSAKLNLVRPTLGDHIFGRVQRLNAATKNYARSCTAEGCSFKGKQGFSKFIVGTGYGTTATRSLDSALVMLGLRGEHWSHTNHIYAKILGNRAGELTSMKNAFPQGYEKCYKILENTFPFNFTYTGNNKGGNQYILDSPQAELFLDWYATFPEAKFIHTSRPSASWAKAALRKSGNPMGPVQEPCGYYMKQFKYQELHDLFEAHNDLVRCVVPKQQLFEMNVFADPPEKVKNYMKDLFEFVNSSNVGAVKKTFPGSKYGPNSRIPSNSIVKLVSEGDPKLQCASVADVAKAFHGKAFYVKKTDAETLHKTFTDNSVFVNLDSMGRLIHEAAKVGCEVVLYESSR